MAYNCVCGYHQLHHEDKLKKCMGCKYARYCSRACQRQHWREHKHVCRQLPEIYQARRSHRQFYFGELDEGNYNHWKIVLRRWADPNDEFQRVMRAAAPFQVGGEIMRYRLAGGASSSSSP